MQFEEALELGGLKKLARELDKKATFDNQVKLLLDDLEDAYYLLEKEKLRGAYTHLFNALERLFDSFLALNGLKVKFRAGREAAIGRLFGLPLLREFMDFYASRRGGMYEELKEITAGALKGLMEFFDKVLSLVRDKSEEYAAIADELEELKEKLRG